MTGGAAANSVSPASVDRARYQSLVGHEPQRSGKDDDTITEVPADAFRIEYYGQGALADVARDPLANPKLFQDFLDRNTVLTDLFTREREILAGLEENGSQLRPLQTQAATRPQKKTELDDIGKKLRIAEEGKLKDLVAAQTRVSDSSARWTLPSSGLRVSASNARYSSHALVSVSAVVSFIPATMAAASSSVRPARKSFTGRPPAAVR
jgi:hypothetical protein